MALYRGGSEPSAIYRGDQPVSAVYRGDTQVWSASIYPVSGTWGPISLPRYKTTEVASHTAVESGNFTFTAPGIPGQGLLLYRNGGLVKQGTTGAALSQAISLTVGDTVAHRVYCNTTDPLSVSWSLVKN